jgi:predicted small secreted protein
MVGLHFFGRRMMKKTMTIIAMATQTFVSACGTIQGVASDTYGAGKFVARQVSGND